MSSLFAEAGSSIQHSDFVLDVGAGIRPQQMVKASRHVCVEPHKEYADYLRGEGYEVLESTALDVLSKADVLDTVVMLDVIEHMDKHDGEKVIRLCKEKANQVIIFTPLGFCKQEYSDGEKDAWGMNGTKWQTHRSGWLPKEFKGWTIHEDKTFHDVRGGAFFAIWRRND